MTILTIVPGEPRWNYANADGSLTLRKLTAEDTLDGGAVLPGFSVRVGDLFPDVEIDETE